MSSSTTTTTTPTPTIPSILAYIPLLTPTPTTTTTSTITSLTTIAAMNTTTPSPTTTMTIPTNSSTVRDENLALIEVATLGTLFVLIVFGNCCVLLALALRPMKMTRMYYYLLHLCVSDLITGFFTVLPQLAWDITYRFNGGNVLCKLVKSMQILGPYLSSYVLVVTAIDRYQAICFPLSNCSWTPRRSKLMIAGAWLISIIFSLPQAFIFSYQEIPFTGAGSSGVYDCWGTFPQPYGERIYVTWYAISVFFVPLVVIIFTHYYICREIWVNVSLKRKSSPRVNTVNRLSRAKIKTVKITVVVILCYIVCSSPFIFVQLWAYWVPSAQHSAFWTGPILTILMLLSSLNSFVNPFIYLLFNQNLGKSLLNYCCRIKFTDDFIINKTNASEMNSYYVNNDRQDSSGGGVGGGGHHQLVEQQTVVTSNGKPTVHLLAHHNNNNHHNLNGQTIGANRRTTISKIDISVCFDQ
ncbi:oxytocin receptor-like [Oppia nitens]|uniref:oxytocin receptor-like n=1 Tax=Oppia nitens TaxID=1686743 RepID=UPI0023DA8B86|nr:oxytocin receptor-like [Oppia nitens]